MEQTTYMKHRGIAFVFTSEMWAWFSATKLDGPVCVVDGWTYGKCYATPNPNGTGYNEWGTLTDMMLATKGGAL